MHLKYCFRFPFSKIKSYKFDYESDEDLKTGVMKLLKMLRKNGYVIQVFSGDKVNDLIKTYKHMVISSYNFEYYIVENIDFLGCIDFNVLRFMNIYSVENDVLNKNDLKKIIKNSSLVIGFDNYLETAELKVDLSKYDNEVKRNLVNILS